MQRTMPNRATTLATGWHSSIDGSPVTSGNECQRNKQVIDELHTLPSMKLEPRPSIVPCIIEIVSIGAVPSSAMG